MTGLTDGCGSAGDIFLVNGHRQPYVRNSRHEAARAGRAGRPLSAACGFPVVVTGVVGSRPGHHLVEQSFLWVRVSRGSEGTVTLGDVQRGRVDPVVDQPGGLLIHQWPQVEQALVLHEDAWGRVW